MTDSFVVKTESFEGPLDILLEMIEKRKLLINDVSLSLVADDFISHINEAGGSPMDKTADFIFVASTLLLIKSKSLLPTLELSEEETEDIKELERRLVMYKQTKELSKKLSAIYGKQVLYLKKQTTSSVPIFTPDSDITTPNLLSAIHSVISSFPVVEEFSRIVVDTVISLEEMTDRLLERVKKAVSVSFNEFRGQQTGSHKFDTIISFLALLELVKTGSLSARQEGAFDDITIDTNELDVPRYI